MKLLCIVPSYWPAFQYGGPVTSVHGLNRALVKKGVDLKVYTTNAGLDKTLPVNREVDLEGVKVTYFEFSRYFEFLGDTGWQFSPRMTEALNKNLAASDIIHINGLWNYPIAAAAHFCRKYNKPYIITPHGMLFAYTLSKNSWKKRPYYTFVTKRDMRNAGAIHFYTDHERRSINQDIVSGTRSFVVPVGVESSEFDDMSSVDALRDRYPQLRNKTVILFLGRINWKKGLDILVRAFSRILKIKRDVHLLLVGPDENEYEKQVRTWLEEENIIEHATFAGTLRGKEKAEAFAGSDIFVLPSYSEGFSMSVLEAMYCRLPVIISDQCNFPEVAQYGAGTVITCDHNRLCSALEQLIDDDNLRKKMGENGRKLIEDKYLWDKIAEQMIDAYENVIRTWKNRE
ncbi:MAG: glycosyltransferase [Nitrospirota bacterium]